MIASTGTSGSGMAKDAISEHVFLDTEVFVRFGFKYSSTPFKALTDLIKKGRLKLVITDIVIREVEAQIDKAVADAATAHKRFSKDARVLGRSTLDGIPSKIETFDREAVAKNLKETFRRFLADTAAIEISTSEVALDEVMNDYFAGNAPFDSGDKKSEFPDAITVKALVDWGDAESAQILVVSGDQGVRDACAPVEYLHENATMQGMLDRVADDDAKLAQFLRDQVEKRVDEIRKQVIEGFEDRYFFTIDENGEAEVKVEETTLEEVDILEVGDEEATVEVLFWIKYEADISYNDPDMTSYDSETGQSFSWGTRENTVHRQAYARAEVGVIFDGLDPDYFEINYITVTEPEDSFGVPVYDPRDDK
jgi:hypothetical protein